MVKPPKPPRQPPRKPSEAEADLWQQVMGEVAPLKESYLLVDTPDVGDDAAPPATHKAKAPSPASPPPSPPSQPASHDLSHGEAPGLDRRTQTKMRRGQVDIEARIDLHGMTQIQAHRALGGFLFDNQAMGRRSVLVITGKGRGKDGGGEGVLREAVPRWLNEGDNRRMVRAFSHAAPKDGGEGALYVLLKRLK
ncbi:MAG: Smr/MutS family protein [Proteobacteria bacterium]|nr:Smr/MutS family protein [Pseudomonadota bacterium]